MRRSPLLLLLAALGACKTPPPAAPASAIADADGAAERSDWAAARTALERIQIDYPDDPVVILRLARIDLEAYGEVERAEARYERLPKEMKARALHGLGRCALWKGDEDHALDLFRESLAARPTADCARDLAVRLLARGDPADEALDLVAQTSGNTLRSKLLLAAAGRVPVPSRLPTEWTYALDRARLLPVREARLEVDLYMERACATPGAREAMAKVLAGDLALRRNPPRAPAVTLD